MSSTKVKNRAISVKQFYTDPQQYPSYGTAVAIRKYADVDVLKRVLPQNRVLGTIGFNGTTLPKTKIKSSYGELDTYIAMRQLAEDLIENSVPVDPEIARVVDENFFDWL